MPNPPLYVLYDASSIAFIPAPVEVLGNHAELDNQIAGKVLRIDFAALLPPKAEQGSLVLSHNDPSVRAADETAALRQSSADMRKRNRLIRHVSLPKCSSRECIDNDNIYIVNERK